MLEKIDLNLEKISNQINNYSKILVGIIVGTMFLAIILQVILRYVFHTGLSWPEELTKFLMAWMTFIGSAIAIKQTEHINVELFINKFSKSIQFYLRLLIRILLLAFVGLLIYIGYTFVISSIAFTSNAMGISLLWPRLSISVGGLLMVIHIIHFIIRDFLVVKNK